MKGKHLLLHHYRRAFAIAAVALAIAGAAQAQNMVTPGTKATSGIASTTTTVDWDYQTLQASIDFSGINSDLNIINFGNKDITRGEKSYYQKNDIAIRISYYPEGYKTSSYTYENYKLVVRFATGGNKDKVEFTNWNSSNNGYILNITYNKTNGLTLTDGNGNTIANYSYSSYSTNYFSKLTSTLEVSADDNSTATYNYVRVKGIYAATAPDSKGMYAIKGWTDNTSEINALITDVNKTAYDLTGLKCPFTISPANKNAIVAVAGTIGTDGTATPTDSWGETKNLVVADGDNLAAVNTINLIDDSDYHPVYTGHAITTTEKSGGYTYTRDIKVTNTTYGKWFSFCLPMDLTTIPDGVTVWAYNATKSKGTQAVFSNTTHPKAHTPYFAQATKNVTISASTTGTLDMTSAKSISNNKEVPLVFHGNYGVIAGDGTQYALQNSYTQSDSKMPEFKKFSAGTTIDAFRAYITSGTTSADAEDLSTYTLSFDGDATAIRNISAENAAETDIYTIDGRRTGTTSLQTLSHGLYIQSGKKVVVK